uniref:Uncharacterized protein n=1 Tax=Chelydra serpentina TaxID=8475 RepID=A0A8C3S3V8_CHESE
MEPVGQPLGPHFLRQSGQRVGDPAHAALPVGYAWLCALLGLLGKPPGAAFVAICARQGDSSCRFLSVSDLFDRVIQHSDRLHSLSTEKNFLPNGNALGKWTGKCHTSKMLTPNGKEYVQKIPVNKVTYLYGET